MKYVGVWTYELRRLCDLDAVIWTETPRTLILEANRMSDGNKIHVEASFSRNPREAGISIVTRDI